jgi:branched-chain amino acid transport system substrate-binding protein
MPTHGRAASLVFALAAVLAGCGTNTTVQGGNDALSATTVTVYSDLPLFGAGAAQTADIVNGEALALYDAGGHVGKLHVSLASLNDAADPITGTTATSQTGFSAHTASSDLSTVAYLGDLDSESTAISLPLNNENDILQISPGSPYVGFTDSNPFDFTGDPSFFYPNGVQTFARLVPSDVAEAEATVKYMRSLGVTRLEVLGDNSYPPYDSTIADLVASDAPTAGIAVAGHQSGIDTQTNARPAGYANVAATIAAAHADAVLFGGVPNAGAQALWSELHARLPKLKLFAPSTLATPAFLRGVAGVAGAANATYVTSPILEPNQYPASGQRVFAEYRRLFPGSVPTAYALYGYEAMADVLRSIRRAGRQAANRAGSALVIAFFGLGKIRGVIGDYRINASGDTSLNSFDGYRVSAAGTLVLARRIS